MPVALMGSKLSKQEMRRAQRMAPAERDGKKRKYCLNFTCHCGCPNNADKCKMAHKAITTTAGLDWTVIAELIRRGGLRREKKIAADQVDARIAALRQQAKDNEAAKRARAGTGKAGETVEEV